MSTAVAMGAGALGSALRPVIAELIAHLKRVAANPERVVARSLSTVQLGKAVHNVISVKTLWNVDKEVPLFDFYYPSRIILPSERPQVVKSLANTSSIGNFVVQGTAGQGKSIFLRYLFGQQVFSLNSDQRIPIFVELRRLSTNKSLLNLIEDEFDKLALPTDPSFRPHLLASGMLVMLLDGFDEINPELVVAAIQDIEGLASKFTENLQIIVTARPDSAIQKSAFFRVVKLD